MIHVAISHIENQLNQYLTRTHGLPKEPKIVVTSNLVELDGSINPQINNKVVICLVNVEKDTAPGQSPRGVAEGNRSVRKVQPLYLNLYLMVTGHFAREKYAEALKFLSTTIGFFQSQPVFNHESSPDLDRRIERLTLEIANLRFQELSNLWTVIGGKYLPSVLYKVRMIVIDSGDVVAQVPTVREPTSEVAT